MMGDLHYNLLDNVTLSFWQTPHIPNEVIVSHFVRHLVWDQTQATSQCTKDCVPTNRASSASTGSKSNVMWFLRMNHVWWYANLIGSLMMLISGSVLWWCDMWIWLVVLVMSMLIVCVDCLCWLFMLIGYVDWFSWSEEAWSTQLWAFLLVLLRGRAGQKISELSHDQIKIPLHTQAARSSLILERIPIFSSWNWNIVSLIKTFWQHPEN